jgi:hypothetical protein
MDKVDRPLIPILQEAEEMSRKRSGNGRSRAATTSAVTNAAQGLGPDDRRELVRRTAYFLSERHGFDPARDLENWLEAERQVAASLASEGARSQASRKAEEAQTEA